MEESANKDVGQKTKSKGCKRVDWWIRMGGLREMLQIPPSTKNKKPLIEIVRMCYTCPWNPMLIIEMTCVVVEKEKMNGSDSGGGGGCGV